MSGERVYSVEELLECKQQASKEILDIRAGMQYDDSEIERKYRMHRVARRTLDLQALETEISRAKNGILPSYTELTPSDEEEEMFEALLSAHTTPERRAQHKTWRINFNSWGHMRVAPALEELEWPMEEIHAEAQKERAAEHAYVLMNARFEVGLAERELARCTGSKDKNGWDRRLLNARAGLAREEEYYQQYVQQGEWPERPTLAELAEHSEDVVELEESSPTLPDPTPPASWSSPAEGDGWA